MSIYGHFIEESTSVVALPEDLVSESVILEMKAKQIDLDDFKSASEAVKYICSYYINIIDTEDKVLTEITNRLEKVKNENQLKTLAKDINSKYPEMTKAAYNDYDKSKGGELNTSFNKLRRVCSKFNIKYSDEDKIFQKLFSDHVLLNDNFEWQRRVDYRKGRNKDTSYLRKENILHRIQGYVNDIWDLSFDSIQRKEGIINEQILGGRLTESKFSCPKTHLNVGE